MRMAGDDAILILPAAPERIRSRDTHYPVSAGFRFLVPDRFRRTRSGAGAGARPQARREPAVLPRARSRARRLGRPARRSGRRGRSSTAWTMPIRSRISTRSCPACSKAASRVYYHFGRDTDFDLKLIGWVNRVRAQVRMGAQPPHEFLELGHLLARDAPVQVEGRTEADAARRRHQHRSAHEAAMRAAAPGIHEYELQAEHRARVPRHRRRSRPTAASSAPAPTPACCTTAPTTRAGEGRRPGADRRRRRIPRLCRRTSPARFRSTAASARSSARCTTWSARRRRPRWRRPGPACRTRPATTPRWKR